jgi:hypothetical protein
MDARIPTVCPCQTPPDEDRATCEVCDGSGVVWVVVPALREEAPYWTQPEQPEQGESV